MTSCVVFIAVLFLAVNLALRVGATDSDTDGDVTFDEDSSSQEDHNVNHLLNQTQSVGVPTTPQGTEANYADSNFHASSGIPHLVWGSSEERIQTSAEVFLQFRTTDTPLQILATSEHLVGWLDLSQTSKPLGQISSILISESSDIQGVLESSTSFGFSSRLEPTPSDNLILGPSVFTSEEVTFRIEASTSATDETVSSVQLYDSFLSSIHVTSFYRSRSSERHRSVPATTFSEEFHEVSSSLLGTTRHREPQGTEHAELSSTEHLVQTSAGHSESTSLEYVESISTEHAEPTYTEHAQATSLEHDLSVPTEFAESSTGHAKPTALEHNQSVSTEYSEPSTWHALTTSTEHALTTSTERALATSTEHALTTSTEHALATSLEHSLSTSTEHALTTSTEHALTTSTEHALTTSAEHSLTTSTEHALTTSTEHSLSTSTEHALTTSTEHALTTSTEHALTTSTEHALTTSTEHSLSTSTEHALTTSTEHSLSTSSEHALTTSTEHALTTSTEYALTTSTDHSLSISTEHALTTSTEHAESTSEEHLQSTSVEHLQSTSVEHLQSTSVEQIKSTATERADLTSIENVESTSVEHLESTDIEDLEAVSTEQAESTSTEHVDSVRTQTQILSISSQLPPESSTPIPPETSIGLRPVMSSSLALNTTATHSDLVTTEISSLFLLSSAGGVTYGDSSPAEEIMERESFTGVSSHECPSCSSPGHSALDIASTTIYSMESSTFPNDLDVRTSTYDKSPVSYLLSSARLDTTFTSLIDTIFHTSFNLAGTASEPPSTLFSLPVITQFLPSGWNIHVSAEDTGATIYSITLSEEHRSSSHPLDNNLFSNGTSSFYSSLYLTQTGGLSMENVSHTEEYVFSSGHSTLNMSGTPFLSVPDTSSKAESISMSYTSAIAASFSVDRIRASEATDTSTKDFPNGLEESDTSSYQALHSTEGAGTSSYETLHVSGSAIASAGDLSSYRLIHDSATPSETLEQSMASQLQKTSTEESLTVHTSLYLASLPALSASIETRLLLTSTLRTSHIVPESVFLSSQRDNGRSDVDAAILSTNLTSTTMRENFTTSSQVIVFTQSAILYISTERLSPTTITSIQETAFGTTTTPEQFSTGTPRVFSTSTTQTAATAVPPAPSATVEYTPPHIETSTDVVQKTTSNFTIVIYFDGDCQKANEKKYVGILSSKMLQFIHNVSQTEDKNSIHVGHLKCNPNHIPVLFVHADRTLVLSHLNVTFSNSPRYLRIHSIVLKLTGYSALDAQTKKGESEITPADIAIFATASCICLVLIIAGLAIFAKEIYRKKFANRFSSCPGSLSMTRKTESVALRNIPTSKSDYKHVEMNEEAFVNEAFSSPCEDEYSSVASERKTVFPSSEANSPEETRDAPKPKKSPEKNVGNTTKSISASSGSLNNGSSRHESPGYGLIIGLMGYTKRLERQQQRKQHQQQQQKLQFEESSYYAVPQKRSKTKKNQDNTQANATPAPAPFSPTSRPIRVEDSPVPPPRHLRTLHEVNESYESNEELVPFTNMTRTDNSANPRTDAGLDNPSFLNEKGHSGVDSNDVFHF